MLGAILGVMLCFISFDGDSVGRVIGRAVLSDDVSEVARVSQRIDHGEEIWRAFALRSGGQMISCGGDEGSFSIGVDHLPEIPAISKQYAEAVDATVSVGIGMKLSESAKALMVAKLRGGRQTLLWNPEMQDELDKATKNQETEQAKIVDHYLKKTGGDTEHITGQGGNRGIHAGFGGHKGATKPVEPSHAKPQGDHEEGAVIQQMVQQAADNTVEPEGTHAAQDFESQLHSHAESQEKTDQVDEVQGDKRLHDLRAQVVQVLTAVRQQMPILSQMKQQAPEAFSAIMNLVQGVIVLGKEITSQGQPPQGPPQELGKAEPGESPAGPLPHLHQDHVPAKPGTASIPEGHVRLYHQTDEANLPSITTTGLTMAHAKGIEGPRAIYADEGGFYGEPGSSPTIEFHVPKENWDKPFVKQQQVHPLEMVAVHLPWHRPARYIETHQDTLKEALAGKLDYLSNDPNHGRALAYIKRKYGQFDKVADEFSASPATKPGELDKAGGLIAGRPNYVHLNLPVGTDYNGKTVVQHGDGTKSNVEHLAGGVQSHDENRDGGAKAGQNSGPNSPIEAGAVSHIASSRAPMGR